MDLFEESKSANFGSEIKEREQTVEKLLPITVRAVHSHATSLVSLVCDRRSRNETMYSRKSLARTPKIMTSINIFALYTSTIFLCIKWKVLC